MAEKKNETPEAVATEKTAIIAAPSAPSTELKAPKGFDLVNWPGGPRIDAGKFGVLDLTTMTPARAEQLVSRGFKFLKRK